MRAGVLGGMCGIFCWINAGLAQEAAWRPVRDDRPSFRRPAPVVSLGAPQVMLGAPIPVHSTSSSPGVQPVSFRDRFKERRAARGWVVEEFQPDDGTLPPPTKVKSNAPPPVPPPGTPPPAAPGLGAPPPGAPAGPFGDPLLPNGGGFHTEPYLFGYQALGCTVCPTRNIFQSDHAFDHFISPVSNPLLFEDPRSLTEFRTIFMYQLTPDSNIFFQGGDIEYLGFQARLAVTERLSFVMNKFGWLWIAPQNGMGIFNGHVGLSELHIGPKYTFLRDETTSTVAAAGLMFQLPIGPSQVFQDTGYLSLVPYISVAKSFGRFDLGSFNFMGTFGYSFGVDGQRSDYLYTSLHLDLDMFRMHRFYPLVELNWFHYTDSGTARVLGFEGRDLINFGATGVAGKDSLTLATGFRYKFSEAIQTGIAVEFPLIGSPDLLEFRVTGDLILRY